MARSNRSTAARAALLLGAALAGAPLAADDLREALALAYTTNPSLQAARAQQRAIDEGVPIARSEALPSLSGTATYAENVEKGFVGTPDRSLDLSASLGMPIYAGGEIKNSIRAAKTRVLAGQNDLRAAESGIFSQTVAAYMDVILGQAVVGLNRANVERLSVNLQATRDRYEIGDLTRTDVAQSQSRLALARSQTRSAEAGLIGAREDYIRVIGKEPVALEPPPPLPGLPASVDDAVTFALDHNPDLLAARQRSKAAGYDVDVAGASRLPRLSVFTSASRTDYLGSAVSSVPNSAATQTVTSAQAGVRASIPLFLGGLPSALRRQAQARESASLEQEIGTERQVIAAVRSAYASWQAASDVIASSQTAVEAATLSLEGVRAENTVGNRTILNILDAEQELLNAQVNLVTARRNAYVAGFNLLAAMGRAEADDLGLDGGTLYDPVTNYERVKGIVFDWQSDPSPSAKATRTVDTKAQDGSIPAQ